MSQPHSLKPKTRAFLACTLSAAMIFSLASPAFAADSPEIENSSSASSMQRFSSKLSTMSAQELQEQFTLRNAKGEVIAPRSHLDAKQSNLWSTLDPETDGIQGTATEKVYRSFHVPANKNQVIVAVVDSGVDITHPDLAGHIWTNPGESGLDANGHDKATNGIDDDGDGYVDDVHGWNFLGNPNGQSINSTTLEVTREYARMKKKAQAGALSADDQAYLAKVKKMYEDRLGDSQEKYDFFSQIVAAYALLKENGLTEETPQAIAAISSTDDQVIAAKDLATRALNAGYTSEDAAEAVSDLTLEVKYYYNLDFDSSTVVGDHPEILNEKGYGNNDVTGPDAMHGTHVAGIIAADRNDFGVDGQALNVKIMSIRTVPDGDERDKDVANAIRFAVDHGARVVNMSFGKPLSPQKAYVDAAMKYAEAKGVLLVHAAGNEAANTESYDNNFPNKRTVSSAGTRDLENWIEVGASSPRADHTLPAYFSNWGKTSVDLFAPGTDIVSTIPGNQYRSLQGTSMASPEVAGVAALMLNLYPFATAQEVKNALMSTTTQYDGLQVSRPGNGTPVQFSDLSVSGGVINAYRAAVQMSSLK